MSNPHDAVRDSILRYLYQLHSKARGISGVGTGIRDLQSAMKKQGFAQNEVNSNLDYLIQKGWVREVIHKTSFTTARGTTQQSETRTNKISDIGIDKLETASVYQRSESFSRINVTNVQGVTVIGAGNVVNNSYTDLSRLLTELEQAINGSDSLLDEARLNAISDIGTLQTQLSKPRPDTSILKSAWASIQNIVTGVEFADIVSRIAIFISTLPT
jgi:hypothetical protein